MLMLAPEASGQTARSGQAPTIDTVVVVTHDVFDAAEARRHVAFALANALRFKTRASVVRQEVLVVSGQPYDSARAAETERNLRALGLFRSVAVDTVRLGGRLAALVETRDGWTTELQLNGRSTGGVFTWSVGLEERDVLGLALALGARYRDDPDRTALTLLGRWNRVPGTRLQLAASYDDRSDGKVGEWLAGMPFRTLSDRLGIEWRGEAGRQRVLRFRDGQLLESFQRRALAQRVSAGWAARAGDAGYLRAGLVGAIKREEYVAAPDTLAPVPDSLSGTVGVQLDWRQARYTVVTHYNGFAREEDVDLSTRVRLALWAAPAVWGYRRSGLGPELEAQAGASWGGGFARLEIRGAALLTGNGLDSARILGGLTVASRWGGRQATVLRVEAGALRGLPPGSEFDLGHGLGPRAFGPHAFTGTRSVWGTLEHRWFALDEVLHLLGVGLAGFLDWGGAWYTDQPMRSGGDVGAGLRLGATRATGPNVGRLDVAYRFGDGWTGRRWVLSVGRSYTF
jgi:hypothetical protein